VLFSDDLLDRIYTGNVLLYPAFSFINASSNYCTYNANIDLTAYYGNTSYHIVQSNPSIFGYQTQMSLNHLNGCFTNGFSTTWAVVNSTYISYSTTQSIYQCTSHPLLNRIGFSFIIFDQQWLYTSDNLYFVSPTFSQNQFWGPNNAIQSWTLANGYIYSTNTSFYGLCYIFPTTAATTVIESLLNLSLSNSNKTLSLTATYIGSNTINLIYRAVSFN
jgi:hypothetical protein